MALTVPWTRESLAWLAGLLEGEGSFLLHKQTSKWRDRLYHYRYPRVTLQMTDEDIVNRAHQTAGLGNVCGPFYPKGGRKATWVWHVTTGSDAYALMVALYPWLGVRRKADISAVIRSWVGDQQQRNS